VDPEKIFETSNVDLAAYLMLQGLEFVDCRISSEGVKGKPLATIRLLDKKQNALDLERLFMFSPEKRYREITKYLLRQVHVSIRKYSAGVSSGLDEE
jgi:hypothetical protein